MAPIDTVGRAVDVLLADFDCVFVDVVLHVDGLRCANARGRSSANDGTTTLSSDVQTAGMGLGCSGHDADCKAKGGAEVSECNAS